MSFSNLGLSPKVLSAVEAAGFETPTPIQEQAIPIVVTGRDVLGIAQTGTGKTASFVLPMLTRLERGRARARMPRSLILEPTRELAAQVAEHFEILGKNHKLTVALLIGGVSYDEQDRKLDRGADVVIATPGRLLDHFERGKLLLNGIEILVVDEADRMLDMGFQPQVDGILAGLRSKHQTMFFSATLDGRVGKLARAYTNDPVRHEVVEKTLAIEDATHRFFPVDDASKLDELVRLLNTDERDLALVFVRTKRGVDRLRKKLTARRVAADAMHGGMTQSARKRALDRFAKGRVDVLIATDVAARGLDLDGITHVINFDPPHDHKDYVHRIGRTARAGRTGTGVTFVGTTQRHEMSVMARELKLSREFEADGLRLSAPLRHRSATAKRPGRRPQRRRRQFH